MEALLRTVEAHMVAQEIESPISGGLLMRPDEGSLGK